MLSWILSPVGRVITGVGSVLVAIFTIYAKGRRDASAKIKAKMTEETNRRTADALEADSRVRDSIERGKLLEDDGFKRD